MTKPSITAIDAAAGKRPPTVFEPDTSQRQHQHPVLSHPLPTEPLRAIPPSTTPLPVMLSLSKHATASRKRYIGSRHHADGEVMLRQAQHDEVERDQGQHEQAPNDQAQHDEFSVNRL
ncbi:MAG: hypothetical protein AMXMBFR61_01020 [Fimbriimonadales bacterium]